MFSFFYGDALTVPRARVRGLDLVPNVEIEAREIGDTDKLPIVRLGIGPGFSEKSQRTAVRALCQQTGYDPDVDLANAPYRSM